MQARRAWGTRRAAWECAALALYGFLLERAAMTVFASHRYAEGWRFAPHGVPVAVAVVWASVIVSCAALAPGSGPRRAGAAALIAVALDLGIEPAAVQGGLWAWTPPGPWLAVPIGNSVGWAVIVAGYVWGLERWPARGHPAAMLARRLALAAGCVAALVAVGLAWTAAGAERLFAGPAGWLAWGALLGGTAYAVRFPRRGARPAALALVLVSLTFLADAGNGSLPVLLASLFPALLITSLAVRASRGPSPGSRLPPT